MKKSGIYTKTGDAGETGLVSGNRILKSDIRIDLYGELDELNSRVGLASAFIEDQKLLNFLGEVQSAIFDLGSNLACEIENREKYKLPQLTEAFIKHLEDQIDRVDHGLDPLKTFILPGGSKAAAMVHLCRTSARSVERKLIHFHQTTKEALPAQSVVFLNRLSDYFFVLSRYLNKHEGILETPWKPVRTSSPGDN